MGYIREQCLLMATDTHTPISYYMGIPLPELIEWIKTANAAFHKRNEEIKQQRERR